MRRARLLAVVAGAVLALWSAVGASAAVTPDGRGGPSESDFVSRVNAARAAAGLGPLSVRDDLVDIARRHSTDMATQHRLYHNPSLAGEVTGWQRVGENVGTGGEVASVHDAFMQSQVHREEILSPYFTEIGVGVVWDGAALWVTQVFRQPSSAPAPAPERRTQAARPVPPPPATVPVTVTTPPTTAAPIADPPTDSRSAADLDPGSASVLEDARAGAPTAPAVLGVTREQAVAVPAPVPRIPAPVGVAAGLLALVIALQGVAARRLGLV